MSRIPANSAIATLAANFHLWERFKSGIRERPLFWQALILCMRGRCKEFVIDGIQAFELLEPEAKAWVGYFRQTGNLVITKNATNQQAKPTKSGRNADSTRLYANRLQ